MKDMHPMKITRFQFPGDPEEGICVEMSRKAFLELVGDRTIRMYGMTNHGMQLVHESRLAPDEVACDSCNADPGDTVYLVPDVNRAYCRQCAEQYVLKYAIGSTPKQ